MELLGDVGPETDPPLEPRDSDRSVDVPMRQHLRETQSLEASKKPRNPLEGMRGEQKMRVRPFSGGFAGGPGPGTLRDPGGRFTAVCDLRCR